MDETTVENFQAVKRVCRYLQGTLTHGIQIFKKGPMNLIAYSDADWVGCQYTRRSTSGFCAFVGCTCVSWSAKKQPTVACSSAEAEYRFMASTAAELTWLSFILRDIGVWLSHPPTLYCDNLSALYMTVNPVFHARTKHVEVDYHYVR